MAGRGAAWQLEDPYNAPRHLALLDSKGFAALITAQGSYTVAFLST